MKKSLLLSTALALFCFSSFATILRVNNIPGVSANYADLPAAVAAATAGDTIHVEPSATAYGGVTLDKKLTIIGSGYFQDATVNGGVHTMNAGLQVSTGASSIIGSINFYPGSEQSTVMGCFIGTCHIQASDITVKRNYIYNWFYISNYHPYTGVYQNLSNADIRQNIITTGMTTYQYSNAGGAGFSNISIQNNIFATPSYSCISFSVGMTGYIQNNVFDCYQYYQAVACYGFQIDNNIIINGLFYPNTNVYFNNIGTSTQFGNANGNQENITTAALFTNLTGAPQTETRYTLNPSGPGVGAGFGGIDVGIFGGPDPYRLSGIPPVPTIYGLSAPATTTTSTLPVTISTRSNN